MLSCHLSNWPEIHIVPVLCSAVIVNPVYGAILDCTAALYLLYALDDVFEAYISASSSYIS